MKRILSTTFMLLLLSATTASAGESKCDTEVTKAMVKKVSCTGKVHADAQKPGADPLDTEKLFECEEKFLEKCNKIKQKDAGGCVVHTAACSTLANRLDSCIDAIGG